MKSIQSLDDFNFYLFPSLQNIAAFPIPALSRILKWITSWAIFLHCYVMNSLCAAGFFLSIKGKRILLIHPKAK